jgi:glycosyltransferase involved in cell wall biosynthesis
MANHPALSVVVPCYNEEGSFLELHRRLTDVCSSTAITYELVFVNDGSTDRTWALIVDVAARDPSVAGVNLSRNHGHQLALTAGLSLCRGNRILILDADLQDPPELLPQMIRVMDEEEADVVYGQRRSRSGETAMKLLTASLFYRLIDAITDVRIPRDTGDFRLLSRRALRVFLDMPERHRFTRGMVSWIGFRQVPLHYDRQERFAGETKYSYRKMIKFALDAITAFSIKPLVMTSLLGGVTAGVSMLLGVYSVVAFLAGGTITGWTSLMMVITLLSSVQLIVLGIFGEYIGRMYEQMKGRPLFVIDQVVGSGSDGADNNGPAVDTLPPAAWAWDVNTRPSRVSVLRVEGGQDSIPGPSGLRTVPSYPVTNRPE